MLLREFNGKQPRLGQGVFVADDVSIIQKYLPQRGNGSVLLTTRANAVGSLAVLSIEVEKMGLMEGTQFLLHRALRFDRLAAYGQRLAIPAGTAVRFEPGEARDVDLVPFGGARLVTGGHGLVDGPLDGPGARDRFAAALLAAGFQA